MRFAVLILILVMSAGTALADGWVPVLSSHAYGPERIIAVDKASQQLVMFERKSPLREVHRFPCTTGQSMGDKLVEGDLRTPEGVYFVGRKIARTLDWELYGNIAYALNYPNPIDRINGKTGGGIWLHGRGKTFLPRDTRGCVALKVPDMENVATEAPYGTPVVIGSGLEWHQEPGGNEVEALEVAGELTAWARDWQHMDEALFDHYDAALMSRSEGRSFKGFIANKRNIFANKPWIHVMLDNVRAIPGPGYWVTWFDQYYRTTGRSSTTGKRFYWKRDGGGRWRIVGREYVPASERLDDKYLSAKREEALRFLAAWRQAWLGADVDAYRSFYDGRAVQGGRVGADAIAEYKKTLWDRKPPVKVEVDDLEVTMHPKGLQVAFTQVYEDASGYGDRGHKTMVLAPEGDKWKIESEQWRRGR